MKFDIENIRKEFPILQEKVFGKPLIYLDNAATTQKPLPVIQALDDFYYHYNSNIHRGVHHLSQIATEAYESARENIRRFINARRSYEIILTKGTTESINLVAFSFGKAFVKAGDKVLVSALEHHSNIVPWQIMCEERSASLHVIPINDQGEIILEEYEKMLLDDKVKIVSFAHISNALGTVLPAREMIRMAHQRDIPVLVDGAQAAAHSRIDVQDLDADFYCFSGHKMYAPMGIGVLYGKESWLDVMPPYQGGGEMIKTVSFDKTTYNDLPFKFEAGTPNVGDALALDAAIKYLMSKDFGQLAEWENHLLAYATEKLSDIDNMRIIGTAKEKTAVLSFLPGNIHPFDMGTLLDKLGIALRTGNHCAQPLMDRLGILGTLRASFAMYNTPEEIDILVQSVKKVQFMLS